MPIDLPDSVLPMFRAAGWPGAAKAQRAGGVPMDHPAASVLLEFSGLTVGECGAGEQCARSDIAFGRTVSLERDESVLQWQSLLATRLVCIAEVHHFHGALFMDSSGACYHGSLVHDAFSFEGASFGAAVERLLLGRMGQPMLRPDQTSISLYGQTITHAHPSVYRPEPRG